MAAPARVIAVMGAVVLLVGGPVPAASAVDDLDTLTERREGLERDLDAITGELEATSVRLADTRAERDRLLGDLRDLQAEAAEAESLLADRAVAAYLNTTNEPLALLLASNRRLQVLDRSRLLDGMGRRERALIERAAAARLAHRQQRSRLDALVADLAADEARLGELRAGLDAAFAVTWRQEQELASRRDRQRRVSRSGQRGVYACPMGQPYHFRDTWGHPRSGGRRHRGVDIFAPMGTDVYAVTAGTITRHSRSRLGGIGLYLTGDDGNQYYYAHLKRILPGYGSGRRVEAGELIAENGASGNATDNAPHVHLEVRPGGGANVNPYPYAAAACF